MPYTTVVAGTKITASWANANVRDQVVTPFASTSARDSAITAPVDGMICYITGEDRYYTYQGSSWVRTVWNTTSGRIGGTWRRNADQSIATGTLTAISWDAEPYDSDGFCTPPSSTITIPSGLAGIYAVTVRVTHSGWSNNGSLELVRLECSSAGVYYAEGMANNANATVLSVSVVLPLVGSETITVKYLQNTGGARDVVGRIDVYQLAI